MGADDYQRLAAECLDSAQKTTDPKIKALLREMAQLWVKFADQAKRAPEADRA